MSAENELAVEFTQFLLKAVATDLEATKELLGPGSPLSGTASRKAAALIRDMAESLNKGSLAVVLSMNNAESSTGREWSTSLQLTVKAL